MKQTVIKYGLLSGCICAILVLITGLFHDKIGFDNGLYVGYTGMVLAFLVIYPAMISYRDKWGNGQISFGRSMGVGMLVVLVSCVCYVIAWAIVYKTMMPDFMDKYAAYVIEGMKKSGKSSAEIDKTSQQMAEFKESYRNPVVFVGYTIMEPLPPGILMTLICATILKIKSKKRVPPTA